jgi:outer membrane beta-barrel protein
MNMTKLIATAVHLVLAGLLFVEGPSVVSAQDIQITGPLAGAPACRHCRIYRAGRFLLQPTVSFTLQDEYARAILFGLQAQYHITDWLGIGLWGAYNPTDIDTGLTSEVKSNGQTTERNILSLPNPGEFGNQIARFRGAAALQLTFIPLRGKLSLFQNIFVDTDFYIFAGAAGIFVDQRINSADANNGGGVGGCTTVGTNPDMRTNACGQTERASVLDITWTAGAGLTMMANEWFGLSFEWRALPFAWNTSGTDEKNQQGESFPDGAIDGNDNIYRLNHMFSLGFMIYLPTAADISE